MKRRANGIGRGTNRTPDRRVGGPGGDHQRREIQGVGHRIQRLVKGQTLGLAPRVEVAGKFLASWIGDGVRDLHTCGREVGVLIPPFTLGTQNGDTKGP